jgi:hypothetical protein
MIYYLYSNKKKSATSAVISSLLIFVYKSTNKFMICITPYYFNLFSSSNTQHIHSSQTPKKISIIKNIVENVSREKYSSKKLLVVYDCMAQFSIIPMRIDIFHAIESDKKASGTK